MALLLCERQQNWLRVVTVVFRTIGILLRFFTFFTFFLKIQKVVTFYVFLPCFVRFLELWLTHHLWPHRRCISLSPLAVQACVLQRVQYETDVLVYKVFWLICAFNFRLIIILIIIARTYAAVPQPTELHRRLAWPPNSPFCHGTNYLLTSASGQADKGRQLVFRVCQDAVTTGGSGFCRRHSITVTQA